MKSSRNDYVGNDSPTLPGRRQLLSSGVGLVTASWLLGNSVLAQAGEPVRVMCLPIIPNR